MRQLIIALFVIAFSYGPALAEWKKNPDTIVVYFPGFKGETALAQNVTTYLYLQMAMTGRRLPTPTNPHDRDFGSTLYNWSFDGHALDSHEKIIEDGQSENIFAQIAVWGEARRFAGEVIVDANVTLPKFAKPGTCGRRAAPCDFRDENFEVWKVPGPGGDLSVGPPRRRFAIKAVRLKAARVDEFRQAAGLPITKDRDGGPVIGRTTNSMKFLEFNPGGPLTPTKVSSGGVIGYVRLPGLSDEQSEFQPMLGGILQVFRGDWDWAARSFDQVLAIRSARKPIIRDALLYAGRIAFERGRNGMEALAQARRLAPYDRKVAKYVVVGFLAKGDLVSARKALDQSRRLFRDQDPWLVQAEKVLQISR